MTFSAEKGTCLRAKFHFVPETVLRSIMRVPKTEFPMRHSLLSPEIKGIFNRNFNVVTAVNFCVMLAYYQILVTTTLFVQERFDAPLSIAGTCSGIMVIGCLMGRFLTGNLLSTLGGRRVLTGGAVLYALMALLNPLVPTLTLFLAQRLVAGFAMGVIGTATGTIMAYSLPVTVQGLGVSFFSLSTALALALGPCLGISVVHVLGYSALNGDLIALTLLSLAIALTLATPPHVKSVCRSLFKLKNYIDVRVLPFASVTLIMTMGYGSITAYLATLAAERSLETAASVFFLISALCTITTRPLTGRLFDRYGENLVIYPAILCTALALTLLAVAKSSWLLLIAGVFQGLGFGNFQSAGQAIALRLVKKYRFPQATSTFFIFFDLGIGISPYIFGEIALKSDFGVMYLCLAALTALSLLLYYAVHGKNHPLRRSLRRHG